MKLTQNLPKWHIDTLFFKCIAILQLTLTGFITNAQFIGWPNNTGAQATEEDLLTKTVTTKEYTDDNRVRVTASNPTGIPDQYELDVSAPSGVSLSSLSFPAGKWCLLIQMEDPTSYYNVGKNCRVVVVSFNSGTGKLVVDLGASNSYPALTFSSSSRVQLLRVPVWRTVNLESQGELTCRPYNHADGTGGIVAIVAGDILNFNGGIINASGKGYHVGGSYTLGAGGAGQNAATSLVGTGGFSYGPHAYAHNSVTNGNPPPDATMNPANNGYMCSNAAIADAVTDFDISGQTPGTNGGDANNNLIAGSNTSGTIEHYFPSNPTNSSSWSILMMGNSGDPGDVGGNGGGGGGWGGTGGNNWQGTGLAGVQGQNGESGGNAGDASRGGGIVLLKINNFSKSSNISSNRKMIFADGQNGKYGTNGGDGGDGGTGGLGSGGECIIGLPKIDPPASIGGYGQSGVGAQGGEGGDGGECGVVWLMKRTTGALSNHVSLRGGKGGTGGAGGYSKDYMGLPLANNWITPLASLSCNQNDYSMCFPTYSCPDYEVCDCDKVFEQLKDIGSGFTVTNTSIPYDIYKSGFERVYYTNDYNNDASMVKALYYTDVSGTCPVKYKCVMARQELFKEMCEKIYQTKDLQTYIPSSGTTYNVGVNSISLESATGYINLNYIDGASTNWNVLQYRPNINEMEDKDDPNRPIVYVMNCDFTYPNGDGGYSGSGTGNFELPRKDPEVILKKTGDDGDNGGDEPDGDGDPDYFTEDDNAPFILKKSLYETSEIVNVHNLEHSSASTVIEIELINKFKSADYFLYDISGKLVEKGHIDSKKQFSGFSKGVYVLVVKTLNATDIKKIQF